jgi:hypothetical protein
VTKPERTRQKVSLEDRLNDDLDGCLNHAVTDSRNRERTELLTTGLRNENPARWKRTPTTVPQIRGQLIEELRDAVLLDVGDGLLVDASCALVGAHQLPRALEHVHPMDLVVERVEPSLRVGLGRPVERSLQISDFVLLGGPSHEWHSPALPCA